MIDKEMSSFNSSKDEVDLLEIVSILWHSKKVIILSFIFFGTISVFYALSISNQYKASTTLAVADSSSNSIPSSIGQLGGIASLTGINISGGQSTSEGQIAQEIMQSWSFIAKFVEDNNIAPDLIAAKGWNKNTNELIYENGVYDFESNKWSIKKPSSWEIYQAFIGLLSFSQDSKTGLVYVSIEYFSPNIAKQWLDLYVDSINAYMQKRKLLEVSRNIKFLEDEIAKTSVTEMREVFYSIVEEQTKQKMLAAASPEYAFIYVNSSMVPEVKSRPRRSVISMFITFFGTFFTIIVIILRRYALNIS